jgi:hypothetical protein
VGGGLIVLRPARSAGAAPPLRVFRQAPRIVPPSGPSVASWLAAQELLARPGDEARLLDERLAPAPGLVRRVRAEPTGEGWTRAGPELRMSTGLTFGARVDPVAAEVVGLLDGRRTPREAMTVLAQRYDVPVDAFLPNLPGALRDLLRLGILVPVDGRGG